ncbi:bifunctional glycosyltransferase family 2 protein/CDP-glycerol:glycerophosphate glycerophosphotransferase [Planomonospora sp. ID67723]|uniref:bifunctional glycosyltransferase/CDP-glycerol:glycerophosphate glycerophosphotransferase n=1 Tax=Planomonospora sp. ID67723 TaxID=2738134 RepID=UPI0018C4454D|nr:bifunctional glycosyltransferase family 2 protein/CDP-glycerol:glycerophosphate glycerophosphotransferase [Planomonospora sp. ID67723]MBG0827867.1 bifunctional glycosyltransferase family 2 protein/CDP-glycerol:glycerophosphate glycerophosphotransferase [Planomonospora sp. ID67723]
MPLISVIVPIYNVEPYLQACLESLAAQTWRDIEVVMVDDGSPDASAEIAQRYAADDPRFLLVRQANRGLGAARNAGLRRASGEFAAFLDSDDLLPLHALETMVSSLLETGSDLVAGNVQRFGGRGVRQAPMYREIAARPLRRTHVTEHPVLLRDRLVTNKLWRRSFWDEHGMGFPEGVLYEDIAVALRAHFLAKTVDVLTTPVYLWREREGEQLSITQDRAQVKGIEDRFTAVRSVRGFLLGGDYAEHVPTWDRTVLDHDLPLFFPALQHGDDAFRRRFTELAAAYLDEVDPGVLTSIPATRRVLWHLVRHGRMDDALEQLAWERTAEPQAVRRGTRYHLDTPVRDLPAEATRLRGDLTLRQRVDELRWEDGRLVVEGRATLRHLRPSQRIHQQIFASLVQPDTGRQIRIPVAAVQAGSIGYSRNSRKRRDWGGFRLVIDPAQIGAKKASSWHVELMVIHRGMVRRERLRAGDVESVHEVRPGIRLITERTGGDFTLRVEPERLRLTGRTVTGGRLRLTGHAPGGLAAPVLQLTREPGGSVLSYPVHSRGGSFHAELDLRDVLPPRVPRLDPACQEAAALDMRVEWRIRIVDGEAMPIADGLPEARHTQGDREVVMTASPAGEFVVRVQPPAAVLERAEWSGDARLLLAGAFAGADRAPVRLVVSSTDRRDERLFPVHCAGTRFETVLTPGAVSSLAGTLPLPAGRYRLALRAPGRDFPLEGHGNVRHGTAARTFALDADETGKILLTVGDDLTDEERGATNQQELRTTRYPAWREEPLRQAVLFDSYSGRRFSDNPRAVYEELRRRGSALEFLWVVRDGQVELPPDVTPVRFHGREHYEALARCRYVVTNTHLPSWFERRQGQTVLQTWHGSVAKRIGFDTEEVSLAAPELRRRLARKIEQWDYLLSPGPWCTPILTSAFRFRGTVLEAGHPRNDVLVRPGGEELAERVRERLGLPPGRKAVLYAPTRRGDALDGRSRVRSGLRLDFDRMRERLGSDHVLLVRRHPDTADAVSRADGEFVLDVSAYPDVRELYLAADVLVTDYSSAMADFAVTGRPILLYAYDLEHYRGEGRAFYLDLEAEAPGPLLRTTDEVIEALRGLDAVAAEYAERYAAFTARHCPLDDGGAAARVVDRVFI